MQGQSNYAYEAPEQFLILFKTYEIKERNGVHPIC